MKLTTYKGIFASCLVSLVFTVAVPANAGLIGSTMSGAYYFSDELTIYANASVPPGFMVGAGPEATIDVEGVTDIAFDFDDLSLTTVFSTILGNPTWTGVAFNGVIFTSVAPLGVSSAHVTSTTLAGFDDSRVTVTGNQIKLNWQGLGYVDGTNFALSFEPAPSVPEPSTWSMLLLGILGIVGASRAAQQRR